MTNAIAIIQSITNSNTAIIGFAQADSSWQKKIKQSVIGQIEQINLVIPETVEELAAIVQAASKEKWGIMPCGNGSKLDWGGLAKEIELVVSTQKCDRIIQHAVNDLTVTVEAGIKLADLQNKLKAHKQFLPIDPAFAEEATIGGILATADTGSLRHRYGGIRDLVLGVSFIRGDGKIAKAGGKVVKNVAGYDLMKLLIGSYGTLGIISQVTLRTYPIPQASQTVAITGKSEKIDKAIKLLKNSGLTPTAADLISSSVAKKLDIANKTTLLVSFQTIPESIKDQIVQISTMMDGLEVDITTYKAESEQQLWYQLATLVRTPHSEATICKLGVLPTVAVELLYKIEKIDPKNYVTVHIGSGIGILQFSTAKAEDISSIREFCNSNAGFLTVLTAPQQLKQKIDVWGYGGNALGMMATIKQKFDPQQIFNRDRFLV